jgi:hypothetical protein
MGLALGALAGVTVLVALVSDVFVESVQKAAEEFGMTPAFVGFIVVALVGGAAEMGSAFSAARKRRARFATHCPAKCRCSNPAGSTYLGRDPKPAGSAEATSAKAHHER